MSDKIKIGLAGLAGSGKSTVSRMILEKYPDMRTWSFALPIKEFLRHIIVEMDDIHLYGELKEVPLNWTITVDSFNDAATLWREHGDRHIDFAILWEKFTQVLGDSFDDTGEEWHIVAKSSRELQQLLGTETGRALEPSIWVDMAIEQNPDLVDDVRMTNEAWALLREGFYLIRIEGKPSTTTLTNHASETAISKLPVHYVINNCHEEYNDASLVLLREALDAILEDIESKQFEQIL